MSMTLVEFSCMVSTFMVMQRNFWDSSSIIRLINFQRSKPLEIFQEAVPQLRVNPPVLCQQTPRNFLHCHDRYRDQRHTDKKHQAGFPAYERKHRKQGNRSQKAVEELGQIFPEVRLKLLYPSAAICTTSDVAVFSLYEAPRRSSFS